MSFAQWLMTVFAALVVAVGIGGLVYARQSGRSATAQPTGARAYRRVMIGTLIGGVGLVLGSVRHLGSDGWGLALVVAQVALLLIGLGVCLPAAIHLYRERKRTGIPFGARPSG